MVCLRYQSSARVSALLIAALDDLVCRTALKQLPHIQKVYGEEIGLTLNRSLNTKLDALQVLQSSYDLIVGSGVDPNRITIELTETAYFEPWRAKLTRHSQLEMIWSRYWSFSETGRLLNEILNRCCLNVPLAVFGRSIIKTLTHIDLISGCQNIVARSTQNTT